MLPRYPNKHAQWPMSTDPTGTGLRRLWSLVKNIIRYFHAATEDSCCPHRRLEILEQRVDFPQGARELRHPTLCLVKARFRPIFHLASPTTSRRWQENLSRDAHYTRLELCGKVSWVHCCSSSLTVVCTTYSLAEFAIWRAQRRQRLSQI